MLQDVADIVIRVGVLLDDPSNATFTSAYVMPLIDQEYDEMDVELEAVGMQYIESIAVIPLAPLTGDLNAFLSAGQPLATMKSPKYVKWKLTSQTDEFYQLCALVEELDEVNISNIGAWQCRFANGSIQITPSNIPITVKVYFDTVSTNIFDPAQNVIRGTAHILSLRVACSICAIAGDQVKRGAWLDKKAHKAWNKFLVVLSKVKQQTKIQNPRLHGRTGRTSPTAGGSSYA
jgi:hypothetical protein